MLPVKEKTRILFVAEAVTLAHVARPAALAAALDPERYDVHFAHCPRYADLLGQATFTEHYIESVTPEQFTAALAAGKPLYDLETLTAYVEQDLRLLAEINPDVVIGDFRISLGVSAELAGIPYVTISNACWSPYTLQKFTVPELPLTRMFGPRVGQWLFSIGRPLAFAAHCLPMRQLRRKYHIESLGFDLRKVYTHADYTLYADIPALYQMAQLPRNHRVIGPVIWSPEGSLPDWWESLPLGRPLVYVTLGSSGHAALLPGLMAALAQLEVTVMLSTAGVKLECALPDNVFVAPYLPGEEAAKRADLVICNGGSPTTHQALAHGKPLIGIAGNLDQYLNMQTLVGVGAGVCLRSGCLTPERLRQTVGQVMQNEEFRAVARSLAVTIEQNNGAANFRCFIDELTQI